MIDKKRKVEELFDRGVIAQVIPNKDSFIKTLLEGKLHIYLGIDPTANKIHLGHVQNIMFLEDLRKFGAKVTLLFGSFTALIGDPTGNNDRRKKLDKKTVNENVRNWKKQISPILHLGFGGAKIRNNNEWFDKFSLEEFMNLLNDVTVQQLLERDMFHKRMKKGKPLYIPEMLYPIFQGYDSVALKANCELCGTDQTFNALLGRDMVGRYLNKEKFVITMNLIEADGVMMSKSNNTGVFIDMEHGGNDHMFGGIMALSDVYIIPLYLGCTRVNLEKIKEFNMVKGKELRDIKLNLAEKIVGMFWGDKKAGSARKNYIKQFSEHSIPGNIFEYVVHGNKNIIPIVSDVLKSSNSEAKRRIKEGAVSLDEKKVTDIQYIVNSTSILRVGRYIFKIVVK